MAGTNKTTEGSPAKVMGLSRDNIKDIWEQVTDPPLWGNPQSVEGAVDLLEVGTFMADQPIRVGHQRLLERLSRPDECSCTCPVLRR